MRVATLEDFTTEALAIAIRHDGRPFIQALKNIPDANWKKESGVPSIDIASIAHVMASTQVSLQAAGHTIRDGKDEAKIPPGRLDLVVEMRDQSGEVDIAWVEVKVEAGTSGNQLTDYLNRRETLSRPQPFLLTLTKDRSLDSRVTGISWAQLVDAVSDAEQPHQSWLDLVDFLRARKVVAGEVMAEPTEVDAWLPVFQAVNKAIEAIWRDPPRSLHFASGLEDAVRGAYRSEHRAYVTAGPIAYGLRPAGDDAMWWKSGWEWWIAVGTGSAYQEAWVPEDQVLAAAKTGGLPSTWVRAGDPYLLEIPCPCAPHAPAETVIGWLYAALEELRDAGVLEPYHQKLQARPTPNGQGADPSKS